MPASRNRQLTVCIPVYNGERYLDECLRSVREQTHGDFELLIVDDCSSDGTRETVQRHAAQDERIRFSVNERNRGLVGNWNHCVGLASGEWIKFMFQDDVLDSRCIERMMAATASGVPLISCARDFIFESDVSDDEMKPYHRSRDLISRLYDGAPAMSADGFCDATLAHKGVNIVGEPTVVLLHRDVFARYGLFNEHLLTYCDAEYWTRIGIHAGTVHIPDVLAWFRVHHAGTSANNVRSRAFRAATLDKLLMAHEMAFSPLYEPLRARSLQQRPPHDLVGAFWEQAHWAGWEARHIRRASPGGSSQAVDDWNALIAIYPRLGSIPFRFQMLRKMRGLQRRAAKILPSYR